MYWITNMNVPTESKILLIYTNCFILVRVALDPVPSSRTLGMRWEYDLDRTPDHPLNLN